MPKIGWLIRELERCVIKPSVVDAVNYFVRYTNTDIIA